MNSKSNGIVGKIIAGVILIVVGGWLTMSTTNRVAIASNEVRLSVIEAHYSAVVDRQKDTEAALVGLIKSIVALKNEVVALQVEVAGLRRDFRHEKDK